MFNYYENAIDNHNALKKHILSDTFNWHYQAGNDDETYPEQFEHHIYHPTHGVLDDDLFFIFSSLVSDVYEAENKQLKQICHMKVNCLLSPHRRLPLHVDDLSEQGKFNSILYYVHDTTNTIFEDTEAKGIENCCIVFNSHTPHAATTPHKGRRVTVNIVTEEKNDE